jgi:hypothetical protein
LLQNQPVKRVSLQTKYARRRRRWRSGVKNEECIDCVCHRHESNEKSIDCARTLDWLNILFAAGDACILSPLFALGAILRAHAVSFYLNVRLIMPHYLVHCKQTRFCNIGVRSLHSLARLLSPRGQTLIKTHINQYGNGAVHPLGEISLHPSLGPSFMSDTPKSITETEALVSCLLFPLMEYALNIYVMLDAIQTQ